MRVKRDYAMEALYGNAATMACVTGCYSMSAGMPSPTFSGVVTGMEYPRWNCVFCNGVNRWMAGEKPPEKCRSCGAPERA
jgi:rubrerythrin